MSANALQMSWHVFQRGHGPDKGPRWVWCRLNGNTMTTVWRHQKRLPMSFSLFCAVVIIETVDTDVILWIIDSRDRSHRYLNVQRYWESVLPLNRQYLVVWFLTRKNKLIEPLHIITVRTETNHRCLIFEKVLSISSEDIVIDLIRVHQTRPQSTTIALFHQFL